MGGGSARGKVTSLGDTLLRYESFRDHVFASRKGKGGRPHHKVGLSSIVSQIVGEFRQGAQANFSQVPYTQLEEVMKNQMYAFLRGYLSKYHEWFSLRNLWERRAIRAATHYV